MAEKILAAHAGVSTVKPQDVVEVAPDTIVLIDVNFLIPTMGWEFLKIADPERVVVGRLQDGFGFDQVDADQQAAAVGARALRAYAREERERLLRREVADRRPGIEEQAVPAANRIGQA